MSSGKPSANFAGYNRDHHLLPSRGRVGIYLRGALFEQSEIQVETCLRLTQLGFWAGRASREKIEQITNSFPRDTTSLEALDDFTVQVLFSALAYGIM